MFPPQTSLIPVTVALARFLETHSFFSFDTTYLYWYMGTTPFRFLTGPVVPTIEVFFHKLFPNVLLFDITISFVAVSFLLSALGWGYLARKISDNERVGIVVAVLLLILPWRYFSALALDEGSVSIAKALLPFSLLGAWNLLWERSFKNWIVACAAIVVLLLVNTQILLPLIVGIVALVLVKSFKEGKFRGIESYLKTSFELLVLSFAFATAWYTQGFWLRLLVNPSIGGEEGLLAAKNLFNFLKVSLPLVLAIFAVYFWAKIKDRLSVFILVWVTAFFLLTAFRFLSNPKFWMDWTAWLGEIEIGIALLLAQSLNLKKLMLFILPFLTTFYVWKTIGKPALITTSPPSALQSLTELNRITKNSRVFLSGSTVFWLNAFYDIPQVRGGKDEVSLNSDWRKGAWEIREGENPDKTEDWIKRLGIKYVLVHTQKSTEFYHDFKHLEKWEKIGVKIWEGGGDFIVQIRD